MSTFDLEILHWCRVITKERHLKEKQFHELVKQAKRKRKIQLEIILKTYFDTLLVKYDKHETHDPIYYLPTMPVAEMLHEMLCQSARNERLIQQLKQDVKNANADSESNFATNLKNIARLLHSKIVLKQAKKTKNWIGRTLGLEIGCSCIPGI